MATGLSQLQPINQEAYQQQVRATLSSIQEAMQTQDLTFYSNRPPAEIEALQREVAGIVPAGNIVALVTSGLTSLKGRKLSTGQAQSDVSALLRGIEVLPSTLFGTFFVPTAAILSAYQTLLTLTGKDEETAFPDGLWQFYLEFAMREDGAHHANETTGFQTALQQHGLNLSPANQLAAWICAISQLYFQYDDILHCEWQEQVYLHQFEQRVSEAELGHKTRFQQLAKAWAAQRPYGRGHDAQPEENYAAYRRRRFQEFLAGRLKYLPIELQDKLQEAYMTQVNQSLTAYLNQMTILTMLTPERYREERQPLPLWQATIGFIVNGCYYFIPACALDGAGNPMMQTHQAEQPESYPLQVDDEGALYDHDGYPLHLERNGQLYDDEGQLRGTLQPIGFQTVQAHVASVLSQACNAEGEAADVALDEQLVQIKRVEQESVRRKLKSSEQQHALETLRSAPIIINWDEQDSSQPLAYIRRGKRGLGDHAATLFRTTNSMVFDQSHIFFDGVWGLAFAEILTREAISWAALFSHYDSPEAANVPLQPLELPPEPALTELGQHKIHEVSLESRGVDLAALKRLRQQLPKQYFETRPTINDFLIMYRCRFGLEYQISESLQSALEQLHQSDDPACREAHALIMESIEKLQSTNPAILIPLNAAATNPRDRLYPTTFRNPFKKIWPNYNATLKALGHYKTNMTADNWAAFADRRGGMLTQINYFGQLLQAYKKVALQGGSTSTATMKLLGHLPDSFREILNVIPEKIDVLNEILKGEEVMSNAGRVTRGSSVRRFISAKDDNENKTLVWGILTDDQESMCLSLRDFRPHVVALSEAKRLDLAEMILEDQMTAFVNGFNQFVTRLSKIINTKKDVHL